MPIIVTNDTIKLLLSCNQHNSFRVLFDKNCFRIFYLKYIFILALEIASPGNQYCANCIGTLSFLIVGTGVS